MNIQNYTVSCNIIIEYKSIGEEKDYRKILLNFVVKNDKMDLKEYSAFVIGQFETVPFKHFNN